MPVLGKFRCHQENQNTGPNSELRFELLSRFIRSKINNSVSETCQDMLATKTYFTLITKAVS